MTPAEEQSHAVYVLSPGANGLLETSFDDATGLNDGGMGGDDVGWMVEGRASAQ